MESDSKGQCRRCGDEIVAKDAPSGFCSRDCQLGTAAAALRRTRENSSAPATDWSRPDVVAQEDDGEIA